MQCEVRLLKDIDYVAVPVLLEASALGDPHARSRYYLIAQDVRIHPCSIEQVKCEQLAAACRLPQRSLEHYLRAPEDPVNEAWLSHFDEGRRASRTKQHRYGEQWKQDSSTIRPFGPLSCRTLLSPLLLLHAQHVFYTRYIDSALAWLDWRAGCFGDWQENLLAACLVCLFDCCWRGDWLAAHNGCLGCLGAEAKVGGGLVGKLQGAVVCSRNLLVFCLRAIVRLRSTAVSIKMQG